MFWLTLRLFFLFITVLLVMPWLDIGVRREEKARKEEGERITAAIQDMCIKDIDTLKLPLYKPGPLKRPYAV